jgi:outer membrane protein assembly factor BamB
MNNAKRTTGLLLGSVLLLGIPSVHAQDWPQWRGPNRDNRVAGFIEPKEWPKELKKGWSTKVGLADSSPVLVGEKLFVFTREGGDEVIRCLKAGDGSEVWKNKYAATTVTGPGAGIHAGTRSSPAVADGKVVTFGAAGVISCLDTDGKLLWRKDTKAYPRFFTSASPIILDGLAILYIGGDSKGEMVAYDLTSGDEKWKWNGEGAAYASPVLMTFDSTKMLVTLTSKSVVGIDATNGNLLWKNAFSTRYNSVTPVIDGQMVICSGPAGMGGGGKGGTAAYKIEKDGDKFTVKEVWKKDLACGMYNTPLLKDGLLYGMSAGGRGSTNLFCMKAATGETLWTDKTSRGECGGVLDAGSVLILFSSDSNLVIFKPSDKMFEEIVKYKVADSATWAFPIVAGNRIFVKDQSSVTLWTIE